MKRNIRHIGRVQYYYLQSQLDKEERHEYGFFIVGGIIFGLYMGLTIWNIIDSSKKSKKANYPRQK